MNRAENAHTPHFVIIATRAHDWLTCHRVFSEMYLGPACTNKYLRKGVKFATYLATVFFSDFLQSDTAVSSQ